MEHDEMDVSRWVDERLSALEPSDQWRPDSSAALTKLRRREKRQPRRWWLWATISATAAAACSLVLLVSTPPACANPLGCTQPSAPAHAVAPAAPSTPVETPAILPPAGHGAVAANYKESGRVDAPITCELYSDYECPFCAAFFLDTLPQVTGAYVQTGKVRLIHRDFPLRRHPYARLAALYADAAGEMGYYQAAANKLFRTQAVWSVDGDIDGQVAQVVPPAAMQKVRTLVKQDPAPEQSVAADEASAQANHIDRTPTLLCNRQSLAGRMTFGEIQASLDPMLR